MGKPKRRSLPRTRYSEKLQPLLSLGVPRFNRPPDFPGEFGITAADEPELVQMVGDLELLTRPSSDPAVYAQIHAMRALAQIGATDWVQPVLDDFRYEEDDDYLMENLPRALGQLGPTVFPQVEAFLDHPETELYARNAMLSYFSTCVEHHPAFRDTIIAALEARLRKAARYDPSFNAFVVCELMDLQAIEAEATISLAFHLDQIELEICGDFEDASRALRGEPYRLRELPESFQETLERFSNDHR